MNVSTLEFNIQPRSHLQHHHCSPAKTANVIQKFRRMATQITAAAIFPEDNALEQNHKPMDIKLTFVVIGGLV